MAQQHFYSRVPARVSMFNKYDSFDTFAHSSELTREFVERDLAVVYADKLSKNDVSLVRRGEISPVYYQCLVRTGNLVQGCITYLPLDYTKERSAYLTHTLIFDDAERKSLLYNSNYATFNPKMYRHSIEEFDITSPTATPNNNYPAVDYEYEPISNAQGYLKKYDSEFVKDFIGSVLLSLCKKGKNVFFKMDVEDKEVSSKALILINELISILPYNIRSSLSFITYLNDPTKYQNFKLKCLSDKVPETSVEKGIFFDFKTRLIASLPHEDIVANKSLINFFYLLLDNNEVRVEFLNYIDRIVETLPNTQNLNIKVLSDLVFLFCASCGFFPEEQVLPSDEQIFEVLNIYDKYRIALNDEYRTRIYKCLRRYVTHHVAIPKDIFSKIMRLYPGDIKPAKRIVMNVVLELIHTDIMREKLFVFISNNFEEEDDDIKEVIINDLCRVFYGGFMQGNILKFFNANFKNEPVSSQTQIIEKLLLSIRTISIQGAIIEFFDEYYDYLSDNHIEAFYNTFFEMIVECDGLSNSLVNLVNKHIEKEDEELRKNIKTRLTLVLEADYRKKEHLLLPILTANEGFCLDAVIDKILGEWSNRKVFTEYLELLKEKPLIEKTKMLIKNTSIVKDDEVAKKLINVLTDLYENNIVRSSLYDWLKVEYLVEEELHLRKDLILHALLNNVIIEGIAKNLKDVFNVKLRNDGLEVILEYAKNNSAIRSKEEYKLISDYISMIEFVKNNRISEAINIYNSIPLDKKLRNNMAGHLETCIIDRKNQTFMETIYYDLLVQELKLGVISLDKLYLQYKEIYKREYFSENGSNANVKKAVSIAVEKSMKLIFNACYEVSKNSDVLKELICRNESRLRTCILDFMNNYEGASKKWLSHLVNSCEITDFVEYFKKIMNDSKPQNDSFFGKLFGKR